MPVRHADADDASMRYRWCFLRRRAHTLTRAPAVSSWSAAHDGGRPDEWWAECSTCGHQAYLAELAGDDYLAEIARRAHVAVDEHCPNCECSSCLQANAGWIGRRGGWLREGLARTWVRAHSLALDRLRPLAERGLRMEARFADRVAGIVRRAAHARTRQPALVHWNGHDAWNVWHGHCTLCGMEIQSDGPADPAGSGEHCALCRCIECA
jgi:hypothetical protein